MGIHSLAENRRVCAKLNQKSRENFTFYYQIKVLPNQFDEKDV